MLIRELFTLLTIVTIVWISGCGTGGSSPATTAGQIHAQQTVCPSNVASIVVGDGYLQIGCGCTEAPGTIVGPSTPLVCHLPNNSMGVFINFLGTKLEHQIYSTGTPSFPYGCSVSNPNNSPTYRQCFVGELTTSGATYSFADYFYPELTGHFIVP